MRVMLWVRVCCKVGFISCFRRFIVVLLLVLGFVL